MIDAFRPSISEVQTYFHNITRDPS